MVGKVHIEAKLYTCAPRGVALESNERGERELRRKLYLGLLGLTLIAELAGLGDEWR